MVVKTITIKEDAYNTLKAMKRPDESFSDVILRIGQKRVTAKDLFGLWKDLDIDVEEMRKNLKETRKRLNKDMERRRNALTGQLSDI